MKQDWLDALMQTQPVEDLFGRIVPVRHLSRPFFGVISQARFDHREMEATCSYENLSTYKQPSSNGCIWQVKAISKDYP